MSEQVHINPSNSIDELLIILKVSRGTLFKLINGEELRTYTIGRRRFASGDAVREFISKREGMAA